MLTRQSRYGVVTSTGGGMTWGQSAASGVESGVVGCVSKAELDSVARARNVAQELHRGRSKPQELCRLPPKPQELHRILSKPQELHRILSKPQELHRILSKPQELHRGRRLAEPVPKGLAFERELTPSRLAPPARFSQPGAPLRIPPPSPAPQVQLELGLGVTVSVLRFTAYGLWLSAQGSHP